MRKSLLVLKNEIIRRVGVVDLEDDVQQNQAKVLAVRLEKVSRTNKQK